MDANKLLQCFAYTLSHDQKFRADAEAYLKMANSTPGFLGACLDIITSESVPEDVKLSASLFFKNKVVYGWNQSNHHTGKNELLVYVVDNDEKPVVKDMLVRAMLACSSNSRSCVRVLKSALRVVISEEYPRKRWDELLPQSIELLKTGNSDSMYIGLICLSELFRTYRWKDNDERQSLEHLILDYFPGLLQFAENITSRTENYDKLNGELVTLILKIYKFVTYNDLPFTLQKKEMFVPWANLMITIMQTPLPADVMNMNVEMRSKASWSKAKKWAYANIYRLYQRYASPSLSRKFDYKEFKQLFVSDLLPQLLSLYFSQIEQWSAGILWFSEEVLYYILNVIEQSTIQKSTWGLIQPHYEAILEHVIYPLLKPNELTLESFDNDPQEYIHRNLELWYANYASDLAAISLLLTCVNKRGKNTLMPTLEFVIKTLQFDADSHLTLEDAVKIESGLRMFSSIVDRLINKDSPFRTQLEGFLRTYVAPYFEAPYNFLKTRVCEIFSKIGDINFTDTTIIDTIFQNTMKALNADDCLPLQLQAALVIQTFIENPYFKHEISSVVIPTMRKLLELSNDFESDAVSGVMQEFVEQFSKQLQPFGVELMDTIVQQFLRLAHELNEASNFDPSNINNNEIPDDSDKQMAALGLLSTAISILLSFENSLDIVRQLEQSFFPAAEFILINGMEDVYRECCEFVESSTFLLRSVSPISWKVLELIGNCNRKEDSMVSFYLEDFMIALNNFMVYGKAELKENEFLARIPYEIYTKAIVNEDLALSEIAVAFDLAQKVIITLEEALPDECRQKFLEDSCKAINSEKTTLTTSIVFGVTTFNVIISSIITAPILTLQYLSQVDLLPTFFQIWFMHYIPNYKRVFDIKLSVIALLSLLCAFGPEAMEQLSLGEVYKEIGPVIIQLMAHYPKALKDFQDKSKEFSASNFAETSLGHADWDDEGDGFEEEEDYDEDANIDNYLNGLKEKKIPLHFADDNSIMEGETFEDLDEDPLTGSVLNYVDIYLAFKTTIGQLQLSDSDKFDAFMISLDPEDQNSLQKLLSL